VNSWPHASVGAALAASSVLGIGVRTGRIRLGRRRWLHHALYAASLTAAGGAAIVDRARERSTWPVAAATLGVLLTLPTTHGGTRPHIGIATAAATVYVVGTAVVSRSA
jgi:hypothetical protein